MSTPNPMGRFEPYFGRDGRLLVDLPRGGNASLLNGTWLPTEGTYDLSFPGIVGFDSECLASLVTTGEEKGLRRTDYSMHDEFPQLGLDLDYYAVEVWTSREGRVTSVQVFAMTGFEIEEFRDYIR